MGRRRKGRDIDGWIVLDKPIGLSSASATNRARAILEARKAGHGGTLDPMATGILPVALGEATKTVAWCQDGAKSYRFTVRWGENRASEDVEGEVTAISDARPSPNAIEAALDSFRGRIQQVPPRYSALKVDGQRAYALARAGKEPRLLSRTVTIDRLELVDTPDPDHASFEVDCGKGTYVRALARDLAAVLGVCGHVSALRRTRVGPFRLDRAISLESLCDLGHSPALSGHLLPVEAALDDIPALPLTETAATRLTCGQAIQVPGQESGTVRATASGRLVAIAEVADGAVRPLRVFNLEKKRSHDVDHGRT
jgi:tRNA pseudouridine55 synthase